MRSSGPPWIALPRKTIPGPTKKIQGPTNEPALLTDFAAQAVEFAIADAAAEFGETDPGVQAAHSLFDLGVINQDLGNFVAALELFKTAAQVLPGGSPSYSFLSPFIGKRCYPAQEPWQHSVRSRRIRQKADAFLVCAVHAIHAAHTNRISPPAVSAKPQRSRLIQSRESTLGAGMAQDVT